MLFTIARKGYSESTLIENVRRRGTGIFGVDKVRISVLGEDLSKIKPFGDMPSPAQGENQGFHRPWMADKGKIRQKQEAAIRNLLQKGRWPSNVVYLHSKDCVLEGHKSEHPPFAYGTNAKREHVLGSPVVMERWSCIPTCPSSVLEAMNEGSSRYFQRFQENIMSYIPQELIDYLKEMIAPPKEYGEILILSSLNSVRWEQWENESFCGMIVIGDISSCLEDVWRVLKPGSLVISIPEESLHNSNYQNAIALEDRGFEIRDSILVLEDGDEFYYEPKPSKSEKESGTENLKGQQQDETRKKGNPGGDNPRNRGVNVRGNFHPTVKGLGLGQKLAKRFFPRGSTILDPFSGSGTFPIALIQAGYSAIGFEKEEEYLRIADARARYWLSQSVGLIHVKLDSPITPEEPPKKRVDVFDIWSLK